MAMGNPYARRDRRRRVSGPLVTHWSRIGHDWPGLDVTAAPQIVHLSRENGTGRHPSTWAKSDWGSRGRRFKSGQPDQKDPGRRGSGFGHKGAIHPRENLVRTEGFSRRCDASKTKRCVRR